MFTARLHYGNVFLEPARDKLVRLGLAQQWSAAGDGLMRGTLVIAATRPVDDLIALAYPPELRGLAIYADYASALGLVDLEATWVPDNAHSALALSEYRQEWGRPIVQDVRRWVKQGLPAAMLRSARAGTKGRLDSALVEQLKRVRFVRPREVSVPDLPALAAWCLSLEIQDAGGYEIRRCDLCNVPFVATRDTDYCRRRRKESTIAHRGRTCMDIGKVRKYRAGRADQRTEK